MALFLEKASLLAAALLCESRRHGWRTLPVLPCGSWFYGKRPRMTQGAAHAVSGVRGSLSPCNPRGGQPDASVRGPDTILVRRRFRYFEEAMYSMPISKMAQGVQPSATLAAGAKARQLRAEGKTVYDFSLGEPDFNTPRHICEAGYKAMLEGHTHYTAASGTAELRGAIARYYKRMYGLEVSAEQVIVSNGAKQSIHNALAATVGPGDDVIIPSP